MLKCHYAECPILFSIVLSVIMLSVIMVIVVMLSVVMLSVVAPSNPLGTGRDNVTKNVIIKVKCD
jgi:hypothetical protein